jgi:hypothetical protein
MLRDVANQPSNVLEGFFKDALSRIPGLGKVEAEATVPPPILNNETVQGWLKLTQRFSKEYPGFIRYLATKEASGGTLTRDTVKAAQVCVRYIFSLLYDKLT